MFRSLAMSMTIMDMRRDVCRYDEKIALEAKYSRGGVGTKLHVKVRGGVRYADSTAARTPAGNGSDTPSS